MQQTGLFSAVVTTLLTVTVFDLKSNTQDTSTIDLHNMCRIQADPSISRVSKPPFSPPTSAIWVNVLLFLSLLISLTCALLATLLQQSARRYLGLTQRLGYTLHRRARVRAFFSEGADKSHIFWVVEALPALVHLSICLFIAGLLVWMFNINRLVFLAVISCTALFAVVYLWFTFSPIFRPNNSCYSPLSPTIWSIYTGISYAIFNVLSSSVFGASHRFDRLKKDYRNRLSEGIGKTAEKTACQLSSEIDVRILTSTLDALGEDSARAKFFDATPGFFISKHVDNLQSHLLEEFRGKFRLVLIGFLDRTFSSSLISESARSTQLLITCLNAAYKALGADGVSLILFRILDGGWGELLQSVEMAHSLRRWSKSTNDEITHHVRRIVIQVVAGVRERDERWISLAKAEFGVPDQVLRDNIRRGDSAPFSLLIHMSRQAFRTSSWTPFVLTTLTQFDVCNTIPELQHEFCSLWNEIVRDAWKGGAGCIAVEILREIRRVHIGLHEGTDTLSAHTNYFDPVLAQPEAYRTCDNPSHRQDAVCSTSHLTVPSPTRPRAVVTSTGSTTQIHIDDSPNQSPRSTSLEIQGLSPNHKILIISPNANVVHTVSQQAEEPSVIPRSPSSSADLMIMPSDHTTLLTRAPSPSTPGPVLMTLSAVDPPITKNIRTVKVVEGTRYLNPLVPIGPSQCSSQPALSACDIDANGIYTDDLTPRADSHGSGTGENSQVSLVASLPSPHHDPDPDPIVIDTLIGLVPPPLSVPDPDYELDASQCPTLIATLPRPPQSNNAQDTAAPWSESSISESSTTANHILRPILNGGATSPKTEEVTTVPAAMFSDPQPSPIPTPANCDSGIPAEPPSHADSVGILSGHVSHAPGSPSRSTAKTHPYTSPRPSSNVHSSVSPSKGVLSALGGTSENERPIPMVVLSDLSESSMLALTPQPGHTPHG